MSKMKVVQSVQQGRLLLRVGREDLFHASLPASHNLGLSKASSLCALIFFPLFVSSVQKCPLSIERGTAILD